MFNSLFSQKKVLIPLRKKYSTIITALSNDGKAVIFKEKKNLVSWGMANVFAKTIYTLTDDGKDYFTIKYTSESALFGSFAKEWKFSKELSHEEILLKIGIDTMELFQK